MLSKKLEKKNNELLKKKRILLLMKEQYTEAKKDYSLTVEKLISEGYPTRVLMTIKNLMTERKNFRFFQDLIKQYSVHEDSKPQRRRMSVLKEVISSERIFSNSLKKLLDVYYYPMKAESKDNSIFYFLFYIFYFLFFIFYFLFFILFLFFISFIFILYLFSIY